MNVILQLIHVAGW